MTINKQIVSFIFRLLANSLGLWFAVYFGLLQMQGDLRQYIIGGTLLAILNAVIKPILMVFSLPLVAFTLGLFTVVINAAILYALSWLYGPLNTVSFIYALLAGIIIGLVNYMVTIVFERLAK
ncbi:MAG TPA: phage holin family protein [Candidatus Obscuribacterales bacterium]